MAPLAKSVKKELVHSDLYVFCLTYLFPGTHPKGWPGHPRVPNARPHGECDANSVGLFCAQGHSSSFLKGKNRASQRALLLSPPTRARAPALGERFLARTVASQ